MLVKKESQIAFYIGLNNSKKLLKDAELEIGNPGIGGTQYLFLLTVKKFNNIYGDNQAILLTDGEFGLEDREVPFSLVGTEVDAIRYCEKNHIGVLVFNANVLDHICKKYLDTKIRIVLWAHNTLSWKRQLIAAQTRSIQRVVCVSEKQFENMKDTPCWNKCDYINNVIPYEFYRNATLSKHDKPVAIYVGSVMPQKGVHNLLEIWRYVEQREPTAQLYIFGGANVWNPSTNLGSYGTADIYYGRVIQRRLDKLKHPENIHFMGTKGWKDIDKMISSARVGIVNPSHYMRDETFCMSAIEMETHEIPIVSRQRYDGLNSTIQHGVTGYLQEKDKDIAEYIIELLQNEKKSEQMGKAARIFASKYVPEKELYRWKKITETNNEFIECVKIRKKISNDAKLLWHDLLIKFFFLIESGKATDLVLKKMKGKK